MSPEPLGFGSSEHLAFLTQVMALTNRARIESRLHEALDEAEGEASAAARLLDPALLQSYAEQVRGHPACSRGTTHISVIDAQRQPGGPVAFQRRGLRVCAAGQRHHAQ